MISVTNLHKYFGELHVLKGVDLEIKPQEVVVMVGASGSGKSTLLRCLNFLEIKDEGSIHFDGREIDPATTPLNAVVVKESVVSEVIQATFFTGSATVTWSSRSGLSDTVRIGVQLRVLPLHRAGLASRAA